MCCKSIWGPLVYVRRFNILLRLYTLLTQHCYVLLSMLYLPMSITLRIPWGSGQCPQGQSVEGERPGGRWSVMSRPSRRPQKGAILCVPEDCRGRWLVTYNYLGGLVLIVLEEYRKRAMRTGRGGIHLFTSINIDSEEDALERRCHTVPCLPPLHPCILYDHAWCG